MARSFASYLTDDILMSSEETGIVFSIIYLTLTFFPLAVFLTSFLLSRLTKLKFFDNVIECYMELCTLGIIERLCISAMKYVNTNNCHRIATEIPEDKNVYRINKTIIKPTMTRRIKNSIFVLFALHTMIISIVILDKLFVFEQSTETCETYRFNNNV